MKDFTAPLTTGRRLLALAILPCALVLPACGMARTANQATEQGAAGGSAACAITVRPGNNGLPATAMLADGCADTTAALVAALAGESGVGATSLLLGQISLDVLTDRCALARSIAADARWRPRIDSIAATPVARDALNAAPLHPVLVKALAKRGLRPAGFALEKILLRSPPSGDCAAPLVREPHAAMVTLLLTPAP